MANDIWSDDTNKRNNIRYKYKEWIRDYSLYDIPIMVMHISKGYEISKPNENGLGSIEMLVNEAEKVNVKIVIENTRDNNLLEFLMTKIKSDNLGICYDTSHGQLYGDKEYVR